MTKIFKKRFAKEDLSLIRYKENVIKMLLEKAGNPEFYTLEVRDMDEMVEISISFLENKKEK